MIVVARTAIVIVTVVIMRMTLSAGGIAMMRRMNVGTVTTGDRRIVIVPGRLRRPSDRIADTAVSATVATTVSAVMLNTVGMNVTGETTGTGAETVATIERRETPTPVGLGTEMTGAIWIKLTTPPHDETRPVDALRPLARLKTATAVMRTTVETIPDGISNRDGTSTIETEARPLHARPRTDPTPKNKRKGAVASSPRCSRMPT